MYSVTSAEVSHGLDPQSAGFGREGSRGRLIRFSGGICWTVLLALLLAGCSPARADPDSLDAIASDFVHLMLEIEQRDPGHIAAYFGPPEWEARARKSPRSLPALGQGAAELIRRAKAIP